MPPLFVQLVRRLAAPSVAASLAKEELCLSLAAIAQLHPNCASSITSTPAKEAAISACGTDTLARRGVRVTPQCTPQELRMIALGAQALRWTLLPDAAPLADALVQGLYRHWATQAASSLSSVRSRRPRLRLADVLAVVTLSLEVQNYFDATVRELVAACVEATVCDGALPSTVAAEELIAVVCGYLGEQQGTAQLRRLASTAAPSPGLDVLTDFCTGKSTVLSAQWAAVYLRWTQQRTRLVNLIDRDTDESADALDASRGKESTIPLSPAEVELQRTRRDILLVISVLQSDQAAAGSEVAEVSDADLRDTLELVKFTHTNNPVTIAVLDRAVQQRLTAGSPQGSACTSFEKYIYASPQWYPRSLTTLRECASAVAGDGGSQEALQHVPLVQQVYRVAVERGTITEKALFDLSDGAPLSEADGVAKMMCVFAYAREVPADLTLRLSTAAAALTLDGLTALVCASRYDRRGALHTVVIQCLANTKHVRQCVSTASVEALVNLAAAMAMPISRWMETSQEVRDLEGQLTDLVLSQLHLHVRAMPWDSLISVLRSVGHLPGSEDVVATACEVLGDQLRASQDGQPTIAAVFALLEALKAGDVFDALLMDSVAARLTDVSESDLVRLAVLQLRLCSPEMAELVAARVRRVALAADLSGFSAELLVAAALSAVDTCAVTSSYAAAAVLPYRVLAHLATAEKCLPARLPGDLAGAVVQLLDRVPRQGIEETAAVLLQRLAPSAPDLPLVDATAFLCVAQEMTSSSSLSIPHDVYAMITAHVRALPPCAFTSLCGAVATADDAELANAVVDALPRMGDQLSAHQLAQCVFALGEMRDAGRRLSHQVMTEALSNYAVDNVELFTSGRDVALLLHGFAKLQCTKRNLYSVFSIQVRRRCVQATLDFRSISLLLFALGSVRFVDQTLVNMLTTVFVRRATDLAAPDLVMTLRAVSRMSLLHPRLYECLGSEAVRRVGEMPLQAQLDLLHAYGAVEQSHGPLADALAARVAGDVASLPSVSAAVDALTSLWYMNYKVADDEVVAPLVDYVIQHTDSLTGGDLVKLCSIVAESQWQHRPLLTAIATRAVELQALERLEAPTARCVLDTLGAQLVFHAEARLQLSTLARTVSKEVVMLSDDEQQEWRLLSSR